jgi:type IV pilus assembly protein PilB
MPKSSIKKLGELLIDFNYITEEQFKEAMEKQKKCDKKLGEILLELGYISEGVLIQVLEFQLGIPHAKLSDYILNPNMAKYIPKNIARRYNLIPLEIKNRKLRVAMVDPSNLIAIDDIEMISGLKVDPLIATHKEIRKAIHKIYSESENRTEEVFESLSDIQQRNVPELDNLKEMVEEAPIVKLTNIIINQAIQMGASDIHIEPQPDKLRVRYRIDGVLQEIMSVPKYSQDALISRLKIIANLDITQRRPQDGRVRINFDDVQVDMRVSTLPVIYGEKVVIRLLNKDLSIIKIDKLGFSKENRLRFIKLINQSHGIILLTGPTGSGKTTSLFTALNYLNSPEKNIITIEDPVEYQINGINQIQTCEKTGLSFLSVLRSILRQDPDIIMIGEIRDEETAKLAVRAALTGHLVLSTLHTNDAISSISRLLDMGIPSYLVASTLIGVIAQRRVRKLCKYCKDKYIPSIEELRFLEGNENNKDNKISFLYKSNGCEKCNNMGYKGRLAIHEVLVIDEKIREMIVNDESEDTIKKYAREKGMKTLKEDGIIKVKNGISSYEELIRVII